MDDVIAEHIRLSAEKGLSKEEIKERLLKAGWPASQVNEYIEKSYKQLEQDVIIRIRGLTKSFAENTVLQNIDLDVKTGEIFGLIGTSGAGKTTILNLLVGFLKPDAGDVLLSFPDGTIQSVLKRPDLIKKHIGFSTQTPSFYNKLTVRENLEHFAKLYHLSPTELVRRCNALMDLVGLKEARDILAANLSGGMQKRLDIACALLPDPRILILDEPTADLDPILRKQLWELIRQINAKGTTIILASHFLAEIELLCSRIAILQNKKIIELGTAQQLRDVYSKNYEIAIETTTQNYDRLIAELQKKKKYFTKAITREGELVIDAPEPGHILPLIADYIEKHRGEVLSLNIAKPTLGRVFEAVIKR
ncbi:ABC transporter ATP-binding protein [Candidatus Woesearchaeota archaeon]|nr:ABC transporter ATP-binding protein [Candidatus Woesearchaeota archaeon]